MDDGRDGPPVLSSGDRDPLSGRLDRVGDRLTGGTGEKPPPSPLDRAAARARVGGRPVVRRSPRLGARGGALRPARQLRVGWLCPEPLLELGVLLEGRPDATPVRRRLRPVLARG